MRQHHLRAVPSPADSLEMWKRLMNHLYCYKEDTLFVCLRSVRRVVEEGEDHAERARELEGIAPAGGGG